MSMDFDQDQDNAVKAVLSGGDRIITGGAGSGKTSLVRRIAESIKGNCEIMAPTGKAAARLKEATGFPACTIHRALCYDGVEFHRGHDLGVCIVDEASMIDSWLMQSILRFNPKQLVLVGDFAQLPPVGKGQPFHDLIKLRPDIVSTLRTCHRAKGAVHIAALAIREGRRPDLRMESDGESWTIKETGEPKNTLASLLRWIEAGRYDAAQDMILAPRYGSGKGGDDCDGGIDDINAAVKALVNPSNDRFSVGDRVIINKNFANDDLWNGDLGTITDVDTAGLPEIEVDRLQGERKFLKKDHVKEMKHAYALSVHKAQGSQARRVFFMCFNRHWFQLNRPLIYTAITRARKDVVVCGESKAFFEGIKRESKRVTVMQVLAQENNGGIW